MSLIDRFTGITLGDLTPSDVESIANNLVLSPSSLNSLNELRIISDAIHGRSDVTSGIVQGLGGIALKTLTDDNAYTFEVPANQAWTLIGVQYENTDGGNIALVSIYLTDGTSRYTCFSENVAPLLKATVDFSSVACMPITLSPQLEIEVAQSGESSGINIQMVYQVKQI